MSNARTVAIGDIHGCCKALQGLLNAIVPTSLDQLIFLGDYVDRGPDSKGVIDTLIKLKSEVRCVFLLGNHELMFRGVLNGLDPNLWLQFGGDATLKSYGGQLDQVPTEHFDFLLSCQPYFETLSHIFVHASYDPSLPMDQQDELMLYWEHLGPSSPDRHFSGKTVYCGHTPQLTGNVADFGHLLCIDTFCFGNGWLTGIDVANKRTWQVNRYGIPRNS